MRMSIASVGVLIALGLAALGTRALSQDTKPATRPAGGGPACMNMAQGGGMGPNMTGPMRQMRADRMGQMPMSPGIMKRRMGMMCTPAVPDAPSPIRGRAENLGLTVEQEQTLGEIEKEARQKARAVLTPEQQANLGDVRDKPVMETCPMMTRMGGARPSTQPTK